MPSAPLPAATAEPAAWLTDRISVVGDHWVTATVGVGFEAYARIFHPLDDEPGSPRWQDVARDDGRVLHPSAQWEPISTPAGRPIPAGGGHGYPGEPDWGNLRAVYLEPLCEVLAAHTTTPAQAWFAVWEGWGWWQGHGPIVRATNDGTPPPPIEYAPGGWQLDPRAPRFDLPHRTYLLYQGPVRDAVRFGWWHTADWFDPQSPSLFWPDDHAWCVATEIDFDSTLVGGSRALVDAVVSSPALEALAIDADAPYADEINT